MNESTEFTPKELYKISLLKDPATLFKRTITRMLTYLIPSLGLMAYFLYTRDVAFAVLGYGVLLFRLVYNISITKRGLESTASIIRKYEAKLEKLKNAS